MIVGHFQEKVGKSRSNCCRLLIFFKIDFFKKKYRDTIEVSVWIQIRPNIMLGLIWAQIVCKGYQRSTELAASRKRVPEILGSHLALQETGKVTDIFRHDLNSVVSAIKLLK